VTEEAIALETFFARARDGVLTAIRCTGCGELHIPPRAFCPSCHARAWEPVPLSGTGTVASFTVIRVPPRRFAGAAPYAIAAVRLVEGVSLLGRVVDVPLDTLRIGLPLRFRPLVMNGETAIGFGPA
jgi:uncharacterized OB-fold protein